MVKQAVWGHALTMWHGAEAQKRFAAATVTVCGLWNMQKQKNNTGAVETGMPFPYLAVDHGWLLSK